MEYGDQHATLSAEEKFGLAAALAIVSGAGGAFDSDPQ
jgi:hypothetical protein